MKRIMRNFVVAAVYVACLAVAVVVAEEQSAQQLEPFPVTGYLVDRLAHSGIVGTDGVNASKWPQRHTVAALLNNTARESGYLIDVRDPNPYVLSEVGNEKATSFLLALSKQPAPRRNIFVRVWLQQNSNATSSNAATTYDVVSIFNDLGLKGQQVTLTGFITDRRAVDQGYVPADGANMVTSPERHLPCTTMACISSGYALLITPNDEATPKHYGAVYNTTFIGDAKVIRFLDNVDSNRPNMLVVLTGFLDTSGRLSSVTNITLVGAPPKQLDEAQISTAIRDAFSGYLYFDPTKTFTEWAPAPGSGTTDTSPFCEMITTQPKGNNNTTPSYKYNCNFTNMFPEVASQVDLTKVPANITQLSLKSQSLTGSMRLSHIPPTLTILDVSENPNLVGTFFDIPLSEAQYPLEVLNLRGASFSGEARLDSFPETLRVIDVSANNFVSGEVKLTNLDMHTTLILDTPDATRYNGFSRIDYVCAAAHGEVHYRTYNPASPTSDNTSEFKILLGGTDIPDHCNSCTPGAVYNLASASCDHVDGLTYPPDHNQGGSGNNNGGDGYLVKGNNTFNVNSVTGSSYCDAGCGAAIAVLILVVVFTVVFFFLTKKCCKTKREDKQPIMSPNKKSMHDQGEVYVHNGKAQQHRESVDTVDRSQPYAVDIGAATSSQNEQQREQEEMHPV